VNSNDIRDYIHAIRGDVCSICHEQSGGSCETRDQVRCSLDAYLIPVVEAIEEATGRTFDMDVIRAPAKPVHLGA
jgi:predicted metal-binding protein